MAFANSTVAGALVVLGLALADVYVCAAGVLAAAAATITATVRLCDYDHSSSS